MKKRLLMQLLVVVCAMGAYAADYVYTSTQRLKITGDNIVTNGDFANGTEGWKDGSGQATPSSEVWEMAIGEGPNGENALKSVSATADAPVCNVWSELSGTYVITFDIKGDAYNNTSITAADNNYCDFFLNTDAALAKVTSTEEAPVVGVATASNFNSEWKTVAFVANIVQGQFLVMHFEKLVSNTMFTNIAIRPAQVVYDDRIALRKLDFAKKMMSEESFNVDEAAGAREALQGMIDTVEGMMAAGELDDEGTATALVEDGLGGALKEYMDVSSYDVVGLIPGLDISSLATWNRGGNYSANYKLNLEGGNWGHLADPVNELRSAIQNTYDHTATYNAFHEDFPAGKYFFTAEIRNANTTNKSWPCVLTFDAETTCKMFIGTDSIEVGPVAGEDYVLCYMIAEVGEDGAFNAGIAWPGVGKGGAFMIRNTQIRAFNHQLEDNVKHVQAFKKYITQWNAATNSRSDLMTLQVDGNYPWGKDSLSTARTNWDPYYEAQAAKGWTTADGKDAGIASTDELNEWADYQGVEAYDAEGNLLKFQVVRGYQNANNYVKNLNKPFTDFADAIVEAKKTRNKAVNSTGDRDTYKTAILAALKSLNDIRSNTTDATRVADSTALDAALKALNAATEAFLNSKADDTPLADIDFSNAFETDADGLYIIKGTLGSMQFSNADPDVKTNTSFTLGYQPDGGELVYGDVLRVGNGTGTVMLSTTSEDGTVTYDYDAANDVLTFTFDWWFGNLIDKNAYVDLQNAGGTRIAGFSLNRYNNSMAYNEFNNADNTGMDVLKYATGIGKKGVDNDQIYAESNKSSFTLTVNYKKGTVQGKLVNAKNGTCDGVEIPLNTELEDNKIAKFVMGSTYNNADRRSWFDNLKIAKSTPAASEDFPEDIEEDPWLIPAGIQTIAAEKSNNAIYSITGVKLNSIPSKGMYIRNGKKFIVK